jgi:hemerythrin superfamily protein
MFPKSYNSFAPEVRTLVHRRLHLRALPYSTQRGFRRCWSFGCLIKYTNHSGVPMPKTDAKIDAVELLTQQHREVEEMFERFEKMTDRAKVSKKKLADQICNALIMHTTIEEEIFYPATREASEDTEDMVDEAVVEHASAKDLIAQIMEMDPDDDLYDAKVKVLSEMIEHHVEEEEKEMFPKTRQLKLDMEALGQEMKARQEEIEASQ